MRGGELFAEIVMVAALTVGAGWLIWMMAVAQDMRREDDATTRQTGGGGPSTSAGRREREHGTSLTHSDDGQ